MSQLIVYDAVERTQQYDASSRGYQGIVKVIDLRTNTTKHVERLKELRISKGTAIAEAKAKAEAIRIKNFKYYKGMISVEPARYKEFE